MAREIVHQSAAGPHEAQVVLDLVKQFAHVRRLGAAEARGCHQTIGLQVHDVADPAGLELIQQFPAGFAVAAHQPDADLQILLLGQLGQREQPARARAIDGRRLFHEDVESLFDGIREVDSTKCTRRRENHHVARVEAVHGLLISVEANELALLGHIDLLRILLLDAFITAGQSLRKYIGHGHELNRAARCGQRIDGSTGPASATTHQGHLNRVILSRKTCGTTAAATSEAAAMRPDCLRNSRRVLRFKISLMRSCLSE